MLYYKVTNEKNVVLYYLNIIKKYGSQFDHIRS